MDAALIERARAGDMTAFSLLHERNVAAAMAVARGMSRSQADAEDLVAEAFTKVMEAVRRGSGPSDAFRPYLLTTVRRLAYDSTARRSREHVDAHVGEDKAVEQDDPAVMHQERELVRAAFASLPERWQRVLWQTEVEGQRPQDIAPDLGLTANAAAALTYRAREGLREAYLDAHRRRNAEPGCGRTLDRLPAFVRGTLGSRGERAVTAHIESCDRCLEAYLELIEINSELRAAFPLWFVVGAALVGTGAKALSARSLSRKVVRAARRSPIRFVTAGVAATVTAGALAVGAVALAHAGGPGTGQGVAVGLHVSQPTTQASHGSPPPTGGTGHRGGQPPPVPVGREPVVTTTPGRTPTSSAPDRAPDPQPSDLGAATIPLPATTRPAPTTTAPTTTVPTTTPTTTTPTTTPTTTTPTTAPPTTVPPTTVPPTTVPPTTVPPPPTYPYTLSAAVLGSLAKGRAGIVEIEVSGLPAGPAAGSVSISAGRTATLLPDHRDRACRPDGPALVCSLATPTAPSTVGLFIHLLPHGSKAVELSLTFDGAAIQPSQRHTSVKLPVSGGVMSAVYASEGHLGLATTGATVVSCDTAMPGCVDAQHRVGGQLRNDDWPLVYVGAGSADFDSSSAPLRIPRGSRVAHAELFWGGRLAAGLFGQPAPKADLAATVELVRPSGGRVRVDAAASDVEHSSADPEEYQASADVTALVSRGGSYDVADVQTGTGFGAYGGWALVVVYSNPALPMRVASLLDGLFVAPYPHGTATIDLGGPAPANGSAAISMVAWEGDAGLKPESVTAWGQILSDAQNPPDDIANSTVSATPGLDTFGLDVDDFDLDHLDHDHLDHDHLDHDNIGPSSPTTAVVSGGPDAWSIGALGVLVAWQPKLANRVVSAAPGGAAS